MHFLEQTTRQAMKIRRFSHAKKNNVSFSKVMIGFFYHRGSVLVYFQKRGIIINEQSYVDKL